MTGANAPASIDSLLEERREMHGRFEDNARVAGSIRAIIEEEGDNLSPVAREALHCIATKMSRLLVGNATYLDHWKDIVGYATLALKELEER